MFVVAAVTGLAAAFAGSAYCLGWQPQGATLVETDNGQLVGFCRDSPAFVRDEVRAAVWRWRWRNVEEKIPALRTGMEAMALTFSRCLACFRPARRITGADKNSLVCARS